MQILLVLVFVACVFEGTIEAGKILGGIVADPGQFPYQVSVRHDGEHMCGGSIIDQYTILTAAQCVDLVAKEKIEIVVGSNQLDQSGVWYQVSRYEVHENWNPTLNTNDIALIKVRLPIQFTENVQPIAMDESFMCGDVPSVFTGWGMTRYPGSFSNDLLYLLVRSVDLNECIQTLSEISQFPVEKTNICIFTRKGQGACVGDSGGPLVAHNRQIGIASWVQPCGVGYPDVFTGVYYYLNWIKARLTNIK